MTENNVSPLLKQLLSNAKRNADKLPQQRRHHDVLKKFATSLFIYSGSMTYDFLHRNLSDALPSLRTVQHIVSDNYEPVHEGQFRFDELLQHLESYNASKIVSIGEDATRVISRVDYDSETNRLVGFVLPCNNAGLPFCNTFIADSFQSMESCFQTGKMAKYAFVYMAQSLTEGVPSFCLACLGTDNKFSGDVLLKRWRYIFSECKKRGIKVISFGADGDSRELKAMQSAMHLYQPIKSVTTGLDLPIMSIPPSWKSWFLVEKPTAVACIQDPVHLAVKLKSRLMKPSIILPLGRYLATVHHLRLVQATFGKDLHGMRGRDLDHKDKQNYDAVVHIISKSVEDLLAKVPDSNGTIAYLSVIRCVVDSFLNKQLPLTARIEKAWYAVFFLRYWRAWLVSQPGYKLENNFVTRNAYICIEMNAHSLITLARTMRDVSTTGNECFPPWMLGSQSCEKLFRAARSMTPTFSTVVNFGMLGLLRRLHRMHIQSCLEAESVTTGIHFPRVDKHKQKDGHNSPSCSTSCLQDEKIEELVKKAQEEARKALLDLGIVHCKREEDNLEDLFTPAEEDEEEVDVEDAQADAPVKIDLMEEVMQEDEEAISSGISSLTDAGMVDAGLSKALTSMHKQTFQRVSCSALPLYEEHTVNTKKSIKKKRHNPFVEISYNGKVMHIHKTTVVWLFQEGERVSADRLFRVRGNQPYSSQQVGAIACSDTQIPGVYSTVHTGEICVFTDPVKSWKVGRIVQFAYYKEATKKLKQYPGNSASLTDDIGVLCSWYVASESNPARFSVGISEEAHVYCGITSYLCTLTHGCFAEIDRVGGTLKPGCNTSEASSILATDANAVDLLTARHFIINTASLSFIDSLQREVQVKANVAITIDDVNSKDARDSAKEHWVTHGSIRLTKTERLALTSGKELSDQHVNAFQQLLKVTVPNLYGLQNTVLQETYSLAERPPGVTALQIIHVRRSHWVALEMAHSSVDVYDSSYTSITTDTEKTIAKLLHCKEKSICTNIMNVSRQAGVTDCALFAMAFTTHLAFGKDPTTVVFDQNELRSHLLVMLDSGKVSTFPVLKRRRPSSRVLKVESFDIYCYCRMPDDGDVMVCCDKCNEWYHHKCAKGTEDISDVSWYCSKC